MRKLTIIGIKAKSSAHIFSLRKRNEFVIGYYNITSFVKAFP